MEAQPALGDRAGHARMGGGIFGKEQHPRIFIDQRICLLYTSYLLDIGPGPGVHGGQVVSQGTPEQVMADERSITGNFLSGRRKIAIPARRRACDGRWLTVRGARQNNLKNIDAAIPLGLFTVVTGVSGSGKSSLVNEIVHKTLARDLNRAKVKPGLCDGVEGLDQLDKVIAIDQSPIGRTPRSNPATYTGAFDLIRNLFAETMDAKARGYKAGRFSFNTKGGPVSYTHLDVYKRQAYADRWERGRPKERGIFGMHGMDA